MSPEEQMAEALLAIEPPKIEGGSRERREWLALILGVMQYFYVREMDAEAFRRRINGEEKDVDGTLA